VGQGDYQKLDAYSAAHLRLFKAALDFSVTISSDSG
jgi:hypothetical protein